MKRYALYHVEEELYLNDYGDGYGLDSDLYLYTKDELDYIFVDETENDFAAIEHVEVDDDGTECHKSDFDLIEFTLKEKGRSNFNDFKINQ